MTKLSNHHLNIELEKVPDDFIIGQRVMYQPYKGEPELGTVTSINDKYVFVLFEHDYPYATVNGSRSKACLPGTLELA